MKNQKIFPALLIPIILLAWIGITRVPTSSLPTTSIEAPKENFLAPDFKLNSINGAPISLAELQGRPLVVNFWASWCPPCRAEMPAFQQAWQEYRDTDLAIIAINATHQDTLSDIENFIDQNHLEFPILLDLDGSVSSSYHIHSLPTTYIINHKGVITKTIIGGPIPLSLLRVQIEQLLQDEIDDPGN